MKNTMIVLALISAFSTGCSTDDDKPNNMDNTPITAQEAQDLQFLIEEEKLARDVYLFSSQLYDLAIFENIAASEQTHMDRVESLLDRYNLDNPTLGAGEGEFTNQDLQDLYNDLTENAQISLINALIAGATIEDLDIADIEHLIQNTAKANLLQVYDNLTCGSRNHLRAFINEIELNNASYNPQFINQELFDDIINSSGEQCGL
jgi:hypothetical protein